jgi:GH24 family phage-related lysozyme (muramidase)
MSDKKKPSRKRPQYKLGDNPIIEKFLHNKEKFVDHFYDDKTGLPWDDKDPTKNKGYKTIGKGHLVKPGETFETFDLNKDGKLSEEEADVTFEKDIDTHSTWREKVTQPITPGLAAQLTAFEFNAGGGSPALKEAIGLINENKIDEARARLKRVNTSKGVIMQGLIDRRAAEENLGNTPGVVEPPIKQQIEELKSLTPAKPAAKPVKKKDENEEDAFSVYAHDKSKYNLGE